MGDANFVAKALEKVEGGCANMARRGQQGLGTNGLSEFKYQWGHLFDFETEYFDLLGRFWDLVRGWKVFPILMNEYVDILMRIWL